MRRIGTFLLASVCLAAPMAGAQTQYVEVLRQYVTGDADAAVVKMQALDPNEIRRGLNALDPKAAGVTLAAAAALHTEAALRARPPGAIDTSQHDATFQLDAAATIVQFGLPDKQKLAEIIPFSPPGAPVPDDFRKLWYATILTSLEYTARLKVGDTYLKQALALYPEDAEMRLLAGVNEELRSSPRTSAADAAERRHALEEAEKHFRAAFSAAPNRLEVRLRLGRVLQERNMLAEARTLLTPLTGSADARLAYLALLFLGGVEDADRHPDVALATYDRAAALLPAGQAARLAASELRHRRGDRREAAAAVLVGAGDAVDFDPWWTYIFGEYWRSDELLAALRGARTR